MYSLSCFILHYPLHCDLSFTVTIIPLQSLNEHTQDYLLYHLHKEVPFAVYAAQWAVLGNVTASAEASEDVFLQNTIWVVNFVLYFFTF
jgi:hypothetical protein